MEQIKFDESVKTLDDLPYEIRKELVEGFNAIKESLAKLNEEMRNEN
jgi:hypothetical protein